MKVLFYTIVLVNILRSGQGGVWGSISAKSPNKFIAITADTQTSATKNTEKSNVEVQHFLDFMDSYLKSKTTEAPTTINGDQENLEPNSDLVPPVDQKIFWLNQLREQESKSKSC